MKPLFQLFKWDVILLNRNKLFFLSGIVAIIYVGIFYLIRPGVEDFRILLIVLIFNDPVITGFLFSAILFLFDKNQNTLQAISILPIPLEKYLLSKNIILSTLATVLALSITISTKGLSFNIIHLLIATFVSAFIFSSFGFIVSSISKTFNQILIYSIPVFMILAIPFLPFFGIGQIEYFFLIPSTPGIGLLDAAFQKKDSIFITLMYAYLLVWGIISWKTCVTFTVKKING